MRILCPELLLLVRAFIVSTITHTVSPISSLSPQERSYQGASGVATGLDLYPWLRLNGLKQMWILSIKIAWHEEGLSDRLIDTYVFLTGDIQNSPFRTNANQASAERTIAFNQDGCGFVANAMKMGRGQDKRKHRALFEHRGKCSFRKNRRRTKTLAEPSWTLIGNELKMLIFAGCHCGGYYHASS